MLQVYFRDHTESLYDPYIDTWFQITNYHSDFHVGSTFRICSPMSHIFINWPSHQLIHDNRQVKYKYNVYHLWVSIGCNFSILNGHSWSVGKLIPGRRSNTCSLMLQWFIPMEMRCHHYQTIMVSRDMKCHLRDMSLTNSRCIGFLSTKWTYTNQPLVRPQSLCLGE